MQVQRKVIIQGTPRVFDHTAMREIARQRPYEQFQPIAITSSPFINTHPGKIIIRPEGPAYLCNLSEFGFSLWINDEKAGAWDMGIFSGGSPSFWKESGSFYHIHGFDFEIKPDFKRFYQPDNWYAAAFCHAVQQHYLSQAYPGWILETNTNTNMKKVFGAAHGIVHLVQHTEDSWQPHAFMDLV